MKKSSLKNVIVILMTLRFGPAFGDTMFMTLEMNQIKPRAIITGASEGIGRAFAVQLAKRGYALTVVARNAERLDSLLQEIPGEGHRTIVADLTRTEEQAIVIRELSTGERYQLLINNAGFGGMGDFASLPIDQHRGMIALNITALVDFTHAFLQRAIRGDGIIQVASTLSLMPMPAQPIYSATKAFVTSFSEGLWFQCRKKGITIVNLCPGATQTLFTSRAGGDEKQIPAFIVETPEQVAEFALRGYFRKAGPTLVSGWKNRLFVFFFRFISRKQMVKIMGSLRA